MNSPPARMRTHSITNGGLSASSPPLPATPFAGQVTSPLGVCRPSPCRCLAPTSSALFSPVTASIGPTDVSSWHCVCRPSWCAPAVRVPSFSRRAPSSFTGFLEIFRTFRRCLMHTASSFLSLFLVHISYSFLYILFLSLRTLFDLLSSTCYSCTYSCMSSHK